MSLLKYLWNTDQVSVKVITAVHSILNLVVYVFICLCFVGNIYALRANLSIAIVAMVAKYNVTNESRTVSKCHFCY